MYTADAETGVTEQVVFQEGDNLMIGMDAPLAASKSHTVKVYIESGQGSTATTTWTITTNECTREVGSPCQGGLYVGAPRGWAAPHGPLRVAVFFIFLINLIFFTLFFLFLGTAIIRTKKSTFQNMGQVAQPA